MISRLAGTLECVTDDGRAMLQSGPITYEVLVPASDIPHLAQREGSEIVFHTLHYLEGQSQGASMLPRLIGFSSDRDRSFFVLFTTVKNIGYRKALRALQKPCSEIASAIAAKDTALLVSLPEIGKRSAETIIAELNGKVDSYLDGMVEAASPVGPVDPLTPLISDTVAMLTALGETRADARRRAEHALAANPDIDAPEQLLEIIYTTKGPAT
ncbi:MAG: hypothetical protein CMJ24_12365 [Phycisphaerae bacterium]|nr:hypothetical protein [Phycisphaerae bacterium]|tara:strand:+ start:5056 stop:5694 length:639 start_codon:yes stop_codon:yes gene_type:complete